jgi:hypothetical protein
MAVSSLSTFQKAAQRSAFQSAAEGALKPLFGPADASGLLALMLRDAATYDAEAKTGGFDGSILINRWACHVIYGMISKPGIYGMAGLGRSNSGRL